MERHTLPLLCQGMFEPYLKSFYIRSTDPTQIKVLKVSDAQTWGGLSALPHSDIQCHLPACPHQAEPLANQARSACPGSQTNERAGSALCLDLGCTCHFSPMK